ncbi:MAG: hypothetical protein ACE5OZ_12770 [Candidatus Heimdallarchaeota archaeon]
MSIRILLVNEDGGFFVFPNDLLKELVPSLLRENPTLKRKDSQSLEPDQFGIIVSDFSRGDSIGISLIKRLKAKNQPIPQLSKEKVRKYLIEMQKEFLDNHSGTGKIWFFSQTLGNTRSMQRG